MAARILNARNLEERENTDFRRADWKDLESGRDGYTVRNFVGQIYSKST